MNHTLRSNIWRHFVRIGLDAVKCLKCNTLLKFINSSSHMWRHLKRAHGISDKTSNANTLGDHEGIDTDHDSCTAMDNDINRIMGLDINNPISKSELYCKVIRHHLQKNGYDMHASCSPLKRKYESDDEDEETADQSEEKSELETEDESENEDEMTDNEDEKNVDSRKDMTDEDESEETENENESEETEDESEETDEEYDTDTRRNIKRLRRGKPICWIHYNEFSE
jgi:BED zinc finger